jgi:histidinol-phosphate/aromatic aminotransferase/cobyric acid decarboxylase-like protein
MPAILSARRLTHLYRVCCTGLTARPFPGSANPERNIPGDTDEAHIQLLSFQRQSRPPCQPYPSFVPPHLVRRRIIANSNTIGSGIFRYVPELASALQIDGSLNCSYCAANDKKDNTGLAFRKAVAEVEDVALDNVRVTGSLLDFFDRLSRHLNVTSRIRVATDFAGFTRWETALTDLIIPTDLFANRVDPAAVASTVGLANNPIVFLGFPVTNPGQQLMSVEVAEAALSSNAKAIIVLDNAYRGVRDIPDLAKFALTNDRTIYVNTASKDLGLPGGRIGWAIAQHSLLEKLSFLPPYEVSPLSLEQGRRLLNDPALLQKLRGVQAAARDVLVTGFEQLGLPIRAGLGPWVLVRFDERAEEIVGELDQRYCTDVQFAPVGLSGWIRVSATVPHEAGEMVEAVRKLIHRC